uniref:ATP-binding protein n=1 Tax=Candidatus Electronema sp. TaxID=2698783 RepID=UPI004055C48A
MTVNRSQEYIAGLVRELVKYPHETEWIEFKTNNEHPKEIGEYISALSNSAALCGKTSGYLVWGVEDNTHRIVGTRFIPSAAKVGNEELENWLLRLLVPKIQFKFFEIDLEERRVVLLEIGCAFRHPVQFEGVEHIRVGSHKKKLKDHPEKERELWRIFDQTPFEQMIAAENVPDDEVLNLLDCQAYFELLNLPAPERRTSMLDAMQAERMILRSEAGKWNITNLGALLFARQLSAFQRLKRKAIRVIVYKGNTRIDTEREQEGKKGYAVGFEGLIEFINALLPTNEVIETALRKTVPMYPEIAVRELVANALIHQDFFISGTGPSVEIFSDRMEITNPGAPLVRTERFLDSPPRSRNEALASLMRRVGICEERGSGVDKVVFQTEFYQLPAPVFEETGTNTRVVLFAPRPLNRMDRADRVRACYLHACLKYVNRDFLTNSSVRERFGISEHNKAMASRYIREAIDAETIHLDDAKAPPKFMRYVPFWAKTG